MPVQILHSGQPSAPALDSNAGTLIAVLDGCLINGYESKTLTSLSVTSNVATATISGGHSYAVRDTVLIAGATPTELNGRKRIISVTSTTFTYASTSGNGSATGTITAKIAPLANWSKAYSGTNKAAYKSTDSGATGFYVRVLDDANFTTYNGRVAAWRGYESMTDVDTGSNPFPSVAQQSELRLVKSQHTDGTDVRWTLIGDEKRFYLSIRSRSGYVNSGLYFFGDVVPFDGSDSYCCMIVGADANANAGYGGEYSGDMYTGVYAYQAQNNHWWARAYDGTVGGIQGGKISNLGITGQTYFGGGSADYLPQTSQPNSYLFFTKVLTSEDLGSTGLLRGFMPGLYAPLSAQIADYGDILDNVAGLSGIELYHLNNYLSTTWVTDANENSTFIGTPGGLSVDITGPWD